MKTKCDECGSTTITGIFSRGFEIFNETSDIKFKIVDSCNRTLYDLTDGLNVEFNCDSSTDPFRHTFYEINLDCFEDGIIFPPVGKHSKHQQGGDQNKPNVEVSKDEKKLEIENINEIVKNQWK
ncbi:8957_t:CDS:2 [Funneliformis geosporum]|uniref:10501_t:CDS:1 n=1 Tax=Funneliformis geosporum TaxID=1117311 RepID=A0A9W4T4Y8_9GLOM|nr:8957_t:CDS:2 [Funneliformis geosporum]CAI2192746.1 10501_t:CDS:2 [Funneliformis geosporum]